MHHDSTLSRRAFLTLGGALVVRPLLPPGHRPAPATIGICMLLPHAEQIRDSSTAAAVAGAFAGIAMGVEEASRAAELLGHRITLEQRIGGGVSWEELPTLIDAGMVAFLTGLGAGIGPSGPQPFWARGFEGRPAMIDVLEEDDAPERCDWVFHVAPGRRRREAARAAADSSGTHAPEASVVAWDPTLEKYGAAQLNARYRARTDRDMDEAAWCGWTAAKVVTDAALRLVAGGVSTATTGDRQRLAYELLPDALRRGRFDAHKGQALTFAPCTQRLRQPLWVRRAGKLVEAALLVALVPLLAAAPLGAQSPTRTTGPVIGRAQGRARSTPPRIVVSNEGSRDVSVVDLATRKVLRTIPVGARPRGIHALAGGGRVLVALSDDQPNVEGGADAIAELSLADGRVLRRHKAGTDPEQFALLPGDRRLYAANEDAGTASAYDLRTGRAVATLVVGIEPEGVAASPDGRWVYVTAETSNSVSVIDTRTDSVVSSFLVDVRPRAVAFSTDGSRAWVTNEIGGTLTVVDANRHVVLDNLELEGGTGKPVGVVASGRFVYVANGAANVVSVVDARTLRVVARIPVGRRPWGIAISSDGRWLVTANGVSNDVSLVDTATRKEVARVKVGERPWGVDVLP
jgi:PQQ-dependent catabolism-associated beta-propeller protein